MRFTVFSTTLALCLLPAVWGQAKIQSFNGEKVPGSYIVKMKDGADPAPLISELGGEEAVSQKYDGNVFNGFAAELDPAALATVRRNPNVQILYENGMASTAAFVTQNDATWGLERISKAAPIVPHDNPFSYNYTRDDRDGQGVDVYVLDTGIYVEHNEFEGRARWGASFSTSFPDQVDNHGHGTHCAGTVGSRKYGVAKKASLIAVKVLGDDGFGSWSDIIAGIEWTVQQAAASGRPSVISISIQGGGYDPVDQAAAAAVAAGVHFVVAAGNFNDNVQGYSPGRSPTALTVGATDISDAKASFSNYGALVDIQAPGVDVYSTYIGGPDSFASLSGTSMATPHVAGLVAYFISLNGNSSPAAMIDYVRSVGLSGVITGLPADTVNILAQNGVKAVQRRGQVVRKELIGRERYWTRGDRFGKRKRASA